MKKLVLFLACCLPSFGAASIVISGGVLASDGASITLSTNCATACSPGSGITGFTLVDTQNGSGRAVSVGSVTASGTTITLGTFTNSIDGSVEPLNNGTDDVITIQLATVGGGSNLTDSGGNTPTGQTGGGELTLGTNNSTWCAVSGASCGSLIRLQGGVATSASTYPQEAIWNSTDGSAEFVGTCTGIDVTVFRFKSDWVLQQDGVDIHDWGVNPGNTNYMPQGLVSGLSGSHTYRIIQINAAGTTPSFLAPGFVAQLIRSVRCVGGSIGTIPAQRTIIAASGDSITVPGGADSIVDDRYNHFWTSTEAIGGAVVQHMGLSGQQVCGGGGIAAASNRFATLGGNPVLAYLQGGNNDHAAGTSAAAFRACWDTLLTNVNGASTPPTKIISFGILACCVSGNIDYSAYNAQIQLSCAAVMNCVYVDPTLWLAFNAGKQSDGIHLGLATGEVTFDNRFRPIAAGQVLGSSYTSTGPASGTVGSPSTNFTVTLRAGATFTVDSDSVGRQTITCADGGQGGTFVPSVGSPGTSSVNITQTSGALFTFTYAAASNGIKTISCTPAAVTGTNGWVAPTSISFTASGGNTPTPSTSVTGALNVTGALAGLDQL